MKRTKGSIIKRILLFVALIGIPWTALVVLSNGKQKFKKSAAFLRVNLLFNNSWSFTEENRKEDYK